MNYGQLQQFQSNLMESILVDLHDSGLGSDTDLSRIASKMEIDACEKTVERSRFSVNGWFTTLTIHDKTISTRCTSC